jgi:hypothetical protein
MTTKKNVVEVMCSFICKLLGSERKSERKLSLIITITLYVGIPVTTRTIIIELIEAGVNKPNAILRNLQAKGLNETSKAQLSNFLASRRKENCPAILSLGSLEHLCNNLLDEPDNLGEPFVVHSSFNYDSKRFGILVSTKRLLNHVQLSHGIQCDATYKLSWEGFPILIAGVSDQDRVFHPVGISLTSGETTDDFMFLFTGIKKSQSAGFSPKVLLSDAAEAITNGFRNVFGDEFTRAYCFFHVMKNVDEKRHLVKDKQLWIEVRSDISTLQLARCFEEFNAAKELWSRKYQDNPATAEFQKYFYEEYLNKWSGWYEGIANRFPTTNNGLEATNRWIKDQGTLRSRLAMSLMILIVAYKP